MWGQEGGEPLFHVPSSFSPTSRRLVSRVRADATRTDLFAVRMRTMLSPSSHSLCLLLFWFLRRTCTFAHCKTQKRQVLKRRIAPPPPPCPFFFFFASIAPLFFFIFSYTAIPFSLAPSLSLFHPACRRKNNNMSSSCSLTTSISCALVFLGATLLVVSLTPLRETLAGVGGLAPMFTATGVALCTCGLLLGPPISTVVATPVLLYRRAVHWIRAQTTPSDLLQERQEAAAISDSVPRSGRLGAALSGLPCIFLLFFIAYVLQQGLLFWSTIAVVTSEGHPRASLFSLLFLLVDLPCAGFLLAQLVRLWRGSLSSITPDVASAASFFAIAVRVVLSSAALSATGKLVFAWALTPDACEDILRKQREHPTTGGGGAAEALAKASCWSWLLCALSLEAFVELGLLWISRIWSRRRGRRGWAAHTVTTGSAASTAARTSRDGDGEDGVWAALSESFAQEGSAVLLYLLQCLDAHAFCGSVVQDVIACRQRPSAALRVPRNVQFFHLFFGLVGRTTVSIYALWVLFTPTRAAGTAAAPQEGLSPVMASEPPLRDGARATEPLTLLAPLLDTLLEEPLPPRAREQAAPSLLPSLSEWLPGRSSSLWRDGLAEDGGTHQGEEEEEDKERDEEATAARMDAYTHYFMWCLLLVDLPLLCIRLTAFGVRREAPLSAFLIKNIVMFVQGVLLLVRPVA